MSSRKNHEGPDALEYLEKDEDLGMMYRRIEVNDKDKQAFEEWKNKTEFTFEFQIQGEKIEVPSLFKEWCIGGMGVSWQAACKYKELEIKAHLNHLKDWDDEIGRLKKEIDELKEKLEGANEVIDCFYEATKKVGW